MNRKRKQRHNSRKGAITILAAILTVVLVGMVAFSVDIGYVLSAKEELQRTADASALATCWEFGTAAVRRLQLGGSPTYATHGNRGSVCVAKPGHRPRHDARTRTPSNAPDGDVVFGYIADFNNSQSPFQTGTPSTYNAVRVRLHKNSSSNGEVPYFFAKIFGLDGQVLNSEATAGMIRDIKGFQAPADGEQSRYPALRTRSARPGRTWCNNAGTDNYRWNADIENGVRRLLTAGVEVNLFPQGTGSPGNRGTVDIGSSNNSTADIARQILYGISPADLAYHGGKLEFDASGQAVFSTATPASAPA